MAYLLYFGVIVCNLFCVIVKKKSNVVAMCSLIALVLVMGFAGTQFGDLLNYSNAYYLSDFEFSRFEEGYISINEFFLSLGFDFDQFRILIFAVCILLLMFSVKSITDNYNMVILLFTLSMCYFFAVAIRFFIAFSIVIFALSLLLKGKKIYLILSVFLVLLAVQFHQSVYIVLVYLICGLPLKWLKKINKILRITGFVSLFIALILLVAPEAINSFANIADSVLATIFKDKMSYLSTSYLGENYSRRYVIYLIFYLYNLAVSLAVSKSLIKENRLSEGVLEKYKMIALLNLSVVFLILVSQTFIRLIFIPLFLGFMLFAKAGETDVTKPTALTFGKYKLSTGLRNLIFISTALTWFFMIYIYGDLGFNLMRFLSGNTL